MNKPEDDILKNLGFAEDDLLRQALSELNNLSIPPVSADQAWNRLETSIRQQNNNLSDKHSIKRSVWSIATSVALLIGLFVAFVKWNYVNIKIGNMRQYTAVLPDNSLVWLNAGTCLSYERFRWNSNRKVQLKGEALFKVSKGSPFVINSYQKTISVLGTEFNVLSRDNYFEVKCLSGKVAVQIPGNKKLLLTKGQGVRQNKNQAAPIDIIADEQSSLWIKGEFYFNNADLTMVLQELGRQYNIKVKIPEIDRKYSGYFNNKDLHQALDNICLPMGLTYCIIKDTLVIR